VRLLIFKYSTLLVFLFHTHTRHSPPGHSRPICRVLSAAHVAVYAYKTNVRLLLVREKKGNHVRGKNTYKTRVTNYGHLFTTPKAVLHDFYYKYIHARAPRVRYDINITIYRDNGRRCCRHRLTDCSCVVLAVGELIGGKAKERRRYLIRSVSHLPDMILIVTSTTTF